MGKKRSMRNILLTIMYSRIVNSEFTFLSVCVFQIDVTMAYRLNDSFCLSFIHIELSPYLTAAENKIIDLLKKRQGKIMV